MLLAFSKGGGRREEESHVSPSKEFGDARA